MSDASETERGLWNRALAGEGEAFVRPFDLRRQRVLRHAFWHLGDGHDAEHVTAIALELTCCSAGSFT